MSDTYDIYDPSAPEGVVSDRGQYMTAKQIRSLLIIFVVIFMALIPVYQIFKTNTDKAACTRNMKAIYDAMSLYAEQHDGRYPPIDRSVEAGSLVPSLGDSGHVYTWASDVAPYMNTRASFRCPSARDDEIVWTEDPKTT